MVERPVPTPKDIQKRSEKSLKPKPFKRSPHLVTKPLAGSTELWALKNKLEKENQ